MNPSDTPNLNHPKPSSGARVIRIIARTLSLLSIGVFVMFAIGEGLDIRQFSPRDLLLFLAFPFGVILGLALAWRWELLGGMVTIASLAAFYVIHYGFSHGFPRGWAFMILAFPGILFLLYGIIAARRAKS